MPERKLCIARELTKKFEEFVRGYPKDIRKDLRGEIVLIIDKA